MSNFADWFRTVNALSALACLVLLVVRLVRVWSRFSYGQRLIFTALFFYLCTIVYGSIEIIGKGSNTFSFRLVFIIFGNTALLAYLVEPLRQYKERLGDDPLGPTLPQRGPR